MIAWMSRLTRRSTIAMLVREPMAKDAVRRVHVMQSGHKEKEMVQFLRFMRLSRFVANVEPRSGSKPPVFQIDYATWHAHLAGTEPRRALVQAERPRQ